MQCKRKITQNKTRQDEARWGRIRKTSSHTWGEKMKVESAVLRECNKSLLLLWTIIVILTQWLPRCVLPSTSKDGVGAALWRAVHENCNQLFNLSVKINIRYGTNTHLQTRPWRPEHWNDFLHPQEHCAYNSHSLFLSTGNHYWESPALV